MVPSWNMSVMDHGKLLVAVLRLFSWISWKKAGLAAAICSKFGELWAPCRKKSLIQSCACLESAVMSEFTPLLAHHQLPLWNWIFRYSGVPALYSTCGSENFPFNGKCGHRKIHILMQAVWRLLDLWGGTRELNLEPLNHGSSTESLPKQQQKL